jgi:hypothetical protein
MNIYKASLQRYAKKVGLFCNARDEKNIKEWAAHHLLIGFDSIIIFDHKSIKPLTDVFKNFDKRVKIIRTELNDGNIKIHLMNNAKTIAKNMNLDWFIYLDADEFLILNKLFKGVKHFLNSYSYADSIGVNWLMFGSNNLVDDPSGLILENYKLSCKKLDQHVKSFVRPHEIIDCVNPHYYNIRNPSKMLGLNFKVMSKPYCFSKINLPYYQAPAYIAHYVFQSEESYKKRKLDLKGDDGRVRGDMGKEIHKHYNDITNLQPQKYIKQIKDFLNFYEKN